MADPKPPNRPAPPGSPDAPLPRLWKFAEDEPADESEAGAPGKGAKSGKKFAKGADPAADAKPHKGNKASKGKSSKDKADKAGKGGKEKGALLEETPVFDTVEARQYARLAVGVVGLLVALLVGFLVVRSLSPKPTPVETAPSPEDLAAAAGAAGANSREKAEQEARLLLDQAKGVARNNKTEMAVKQLTRLRSAYPATLAAAEAKQALDRAAQKLPLFPTGPAVVAAPGASPPVSVSPPPAPTGPVIDASKTAPVALSNAPASFLPPVNPPGTTSVAGPSARPLPAGFRPRPGSTAHASGWASEIVGDRDGAPLVLVPGGTFVQGRDDADPDEGPAHRVNLGTYYIDKHEVTNRQFALFQKEAGRRGDRARVLSQSKDPATTGVDDVEDHPAVMVSARDAADYLAWAGKRLPTEAQWEAAARTTDGRIYPGGPTLPVWEKPRAPRQIDPVMSFPNDVSPYGAADLAGNAWEWTKDWFDPHYYDLFRETPADNPAGPSTKPRAPQLAVKGSAKDWVVTRREGLKPETRLPYLGFRGVLTVEGPGNAFEPPPAAKSNSNTPAVDAGGSSVPF